MNARVIIYVSEETLDIIQAVKSHAWIFDNEPRLQILFPEAFRHPIKHWDSVKDLILSDKPIVLGTHSEAILNRIGIEISFEKLKSRDIEVRILHQGNEINGKNSQVVHYHDDGSLADSWPFGFMAP